MGTITSSTTHYSATYDASEKVRVSGAGSSSILVNGIKLNGAAKLVTDSEDLDTGIEMETMLVEIRMNATYQFASGPSPKLLLWWNGQWTSVGSLTVEDDEILNRGETVQNTFRSRRR